MPAPALAWINLENWGLSYSLDELWGGVYLITRLGSGWGRRLSLGNWRTWRWMQDVVGWVTAVCSALSCLVGSCPELVGCSLKKGQLSLSLMPPLESNSVSPAEDGAMEN